MESQRFSVDSPATSPTEKSGTAWRRIECTKPLLIFVTDRKISHLPFFEVVTQVLAAGVDWIQLRERDLDAQALCDLAEALQRLAREQDRGAATEKPTKILINRRLDVALALGTDGAHLGGNALNLREARSLLPTHFILGCAAHSLAEVQSAAASGADYVHLAPIFAPRSKATHAPPLGLSVLEAASHADIPVIAQGGITPENAGAAIAAGASGVAVTGEILLSIAPYEVCRALRRVLDAAPWPHSSKRENPCLL